MHPACHEISLRRKLLIMQLLRCNWCERHTIPCFVFGNWPSRFWDDHIATIVRKRGSQYRMSGCKPSRKPTALLTAFGSPDQNATKWQHIGDWIDAAIVSAVPDFVNVHFFA